MFTIVDKNQDQVISHLARTCIPEGFWVEKGAKQVTREIDGSGCGRVFVLLFPPAHLSYKLVLSRIKTFFVIGVQERC